MKILFTLCFLLFAAFPVYADDALDKQLEAKKVTEWTKDAVAEALTFSHDNIKDRFALNEKDFTTEGWTAFRGFLNDRKIMQDVLQYQKTLHADVPDEAAVTEEGAAGGVYRWTLEMSADVKGILPSADDGSVQVVPMPIRVNVLRVAASENRDGLKISAWELLPPPQDQIPADMPPVAPQQDVP